MKKILIALALVASSIQGPALAGSGTLLVPPVDALVERDFDAPATRWGPGHRGVDLAAPPGTAVRAAGEGIVTFAGDVAGVQAVTISHGSGLESTYSDLLSLSVRAGDVVDQGRWIGRSGEAHEGSAGLHFGVKRWGEYVDPLSLFGPIDATSAVHLVPLEDGDVASPGGEVSCTAAADLTEPVGPPNGNIAVAIAGIGSRTEGGVSAEMYEEGPQHLGYPAKRIYRFSYRGLAGHRLHDPYSTVDTFGDLTVAAERLRDLLEEIGRKHPGVPVDLIAHSQGGIVARTLLTLGAESWDGALPRIAHLVTFASPHQGAPAAGASQRLRNDTATGGWLLGGLSRWARAGGPIPDPDSVAAQQLAPGSPLMEQLGRQDVLWGTRVLALAIPNDIVVPADRALWPEKLGRVVAPRGLWGHGKIVSSPMARGLVHDFLSDSGHPCTSSWDTWGPRVGRAVGAVEGGMPLGYRVVEDVSGVGTAAKVLRGVKALLDGLR